jgi:hypothetical protein
LKCFLIHKSHIAPRQPTLYQFINVDIVIKKKMFSRSFIKTSSDREQDIAARAKVTRESVRRSPVCSGEHNYTYAHTGFRAFRDAAAQSNYAENLINDYNEVYEKGNTTLPYHAALTALHHQAASTAVTTFMAQERNTRRLVHMHDAPPTPPTPPTPAPPTPPTPPTPAPTPFMRDHTLSQHLLHEMQFALPPHHPKRLVIFRAPGLGIVNFDPTQLPVERRFVKTCCNQLSSAESCGCHVGSGHESARYVNAFGESMNVWYYTRKNRYFNIAYRMWGDDSDLEKHVPHSPKGDVSETEIHPCLVDDDFEDEIKKATEASREGFTYVWKNQSFRRRHERRQRRCQQLASGELPKYGLIVVDVDTDETRAAMPPHPIPGHDEDMCRHNKETYEQIRDHVHSRAIKEGTIAPAPAPAPAHPPPPPLPPASPAPAPAPAPRFNTTGLRSFEIRRLIRQEYKDQSVRVIQRPLTHESLCIAHAVSRLQVTEISALQIHQHRRLIATAPLAARLAILFCAEKGHTADVAVMLHYRMIQYILRRATGSMCRARQISAPYIKCERYYDKQISPERIQQLKANAEMRFDLDCPWAMPRDAPPPSGLYPCSTSGGPIEYHLAKYYAEKCLELIGNPDIPTMAAARWTKLDDQILRVRRGEIAPWKVFASRDDNEWVYSINYTYIAAVKHFLSAVERWRNVDESTRNFAPPGYKCPSIWHNSQISKDSPAYVQCVQILHEMYRFIHRAARVISPRYMAVFGLSQRYANSIIQRTKYLAYHDGDETSALMFGFLMPAMMTPDVHVDLYVEGHLFQDSRLYVKMSDPIFGPMKKQLKNVIPSRHTGTIDRTTLMNEPTKRYRA